MSTDIIALCVAVIATITTILIFVFQPGAKEDANRRALHSLELFCPPNWGTVTADKALKKLSWLYKELQYASRGRSFIITRAAAWEMKKIITEVIKKNDDDPEVIIDEADSMRLYVWKTLIAIAVGKKEFTLWARRAQKKFRGKLLRAIKHTIWVLKKYDKMNGTTMFDDNRLSLLDFKNKLV